MRGMRPASAFLPRSNSHPVDVFLQRARQERVQPHHRDVFFAGGKEVARSSAGTDAENSTGGSRRFFEVCFFLSTESPPLVSVAFVRVTHL